MKTSYLGIDPGLNGGFAVISGDQICYKLVMPLITTITNKGKIKKEIDRNGVLSFLSAIPPPLRAAIEEQEAFRGQNIVSTCTQCKNYGILLMAFTAARINYTEVPSDIWQKQFEIVPADKAGGKTTKEQAFDIVQMLYPNEDFKKSNRSHTFHTGIVDAVLISNYCQALFSQEGKQ